jgi:hypothetical protein
MTMMKHLAALPLIFLLFAGSAWGLDQKFVEPVLPVSPTLKGQGGVSTANAEGWDALFVNPAAYATKTNSLTFLDLGGTAYLPLSVISQTLENRNSLMNFDFTDPNNPNTALLNSLLTQYGVGVDATLGAGWVGNNLGVGFLVQTQTFAKGKSLLGSVMTVEQSIMGVVGMAWPFDVGLGTLKLGGALRPIQRTYADLPVSGVLSNLANLSAYTVESGFGLGWDLGARWDYGPFKTGLVIRDAGSTVIGFKEYNAQEWITGLGFPSGGATTGSTLYRVPAVLGVGASWVPDVGSVASMVQPSLSVDFQIPIKDEFTQPSFWTWTHIGAEAKFLQFLSLRTGLNQGYFTFGLGAKLFILDFNLAIYADELGRYSGLNRRSAVALEWAFRI